MKEMSNNKKEWQEKRKKNQRKLWGECRTVVKFHEMGNHVEESVMK